MQTPPEAPRQRILLLTATFPPTRCGVGDYARRLAVELARHGHEVFVLTGVGEEPDHQHTADDDLEVGAPAAPVSVAAPRFDPAGARLWVARAVAAWDWSSLDLLRAALGAVRPDVVSLQYHGEDYLLHPAVCHVPAVATEREIPTAVTFHNLQRPRAWEDEVDPLRTLLDASATWICTNVLDEARLRDHAPAGDGGRLHRITAGPCIITDHERHPPAEGPFEIGYYGFLNPQKGLEYLLRAAATLRDEGRSLRLTLAAGVHTDAPGRLRDYARFVEQEIDRLRLRDGIDWRGYLPETEVSRLLARCHLGVFPFRDGLSGKNSSFWSVLHHATPALTTRGEGLPEGLVDGDNVLLAKPRDQSDLARRMAWAMDHRFELEAVGRRGRRYVLEQLDWSSLARRMAQALTSRRERSGEVAEA